MSHWFRLFRTTSESSHASKRPRRVSVESLESRTLLTFVDPVNYAGGGSIVGDFNNDGLDDLAGVSDAKVSVLLGHGDGSFQAGRTSATIPAGGSLWQTKDLNGDGNLDLAGIDSGGVIILAGNGDGTFQDPLQIALERPPRSLALGDFDSDGKLDIAATSNTAQYRPRPCGNYRGATRREPSCRGLGGIWTYNGYTHVLRGDGNGGFMPSVTQHIGYFVPTISGLGDFDEDGNLDAVLAGRLLTGNGDGTFQAPVALPAGNTTAHDLAIVDLNGDNHLDLVAGNRYSIDVQAMLGQGDGTFSNPISTSLYGLPADSLVSSDVNLDGRPDLVVVSSGICNAQGNSCTWGPDTARITVFMGQGDGTFGAHSQYASAVGLPAIGNFDNNAYPDLALANGPDVGVRINSTHWIPALNITGASVVESDDGSVTASFVVRITSSPAERVTVNYETADQMAGAVAGKDYTPVSGTLTFEPGGPTTQTILVPIAGDLTPEYDEQFNVLLSNPMNATIYNSTASGLIADNDPPPTVSISDASIKEGHNGTRFLEFRVTLSSAIEREVSINYFTLDGSAKEAKNDYVPAWGLITINAGSTEATIAIEVKGDRKKESNETFSVNIENASNAIIMDSVAIGTILNDD